MSDDVSDRARETIARELSPYFWHSGLDEISAEGVVGQERTRSLAHGDQMIAALDAAGIALVDARELWELRDEKQRLLAFRDAFDRLVFNIGWGADEQHRYRVVRECRAAVADIEP